MRERQDEIAKQSVSVSDNHQSSLEAKQSKQDADNLTPSVQLGFYFSGLELAAVDQPKTS
jgi:hypothetical protein